MTRKTKSPHFYTFDEKLSLEQQLFDINCKLDYILEILTAPEFRFNYPVNKDPNANNYDWYFH